jgi:Lrp/AsnC family leucine-responsive transcriptional regulator
MTRALSATDRKILRAVQQQGRITGAALAERVGMEASPCLRRLHALEEAGVITGYRAALDHAALGYAVEAFVFIKLSQSEPGWRTRLVARLNDEPDVIACWALAGDTDLLARVVATDMAAFGEFTLNRLLTLPGVADVRSGFVLSVIKQDSGVPVPE